MARRRSSKQDATGLLFIVLAVALVFALVAASVLATAALFFVAVWNWIRARRMPKANSAAVFAHTDAERKALAAAAQAEKVASDELIEVDRRGAGRARRKDRMFHDRGEGIELNEMMRRANRAQDEARQALRMLHGLPAHRLSVYVHTQAKALASVTGVLVLGLVFVALVVGEPVVTQSYGAWLSAFLKIDAGPELGRLLASSTFAGAIGWAVYGIGEPIAASILRRRLLTGA